MPDYVLADRRKNWEKHGERVSVKDYLAKGNGTTVDTSALQDGIRSVVARSKAVPGPGGWYGRVPTLYFPAGEYVIKTKGALTPDVGTGLGAKPVKGFNLVGDGPANTRVVLDYADAADNWLIQNTNTFAFSTVKDIWFYATNGVERFMLMDGAAGSPPGLIRFENVIWTGFRDVIKTTGTQNADELKFINCRWENIPANGTGFWSQNLQTVIVDMISCSWLPAMQGAAIVFEAGGILNVWGGGCVCTGTGVWLLLTDQVGTGIGSSNSTFSVNGMKPEILEDSQLFYVGAGCELNLDNVHCWTTSAGKELTKKGTIALQGRVNFSKCHSRYLIRLETDGTTYALAHQSMLNFRDCNLEKQLIDLIIDGNTGFNTGGIWKARADGCRLIIPADNSKANEPVDVAINMDWAFTDATVPLKKFVFRASADSAVGLPAGGSTATLKLPVGAVLKRVRVVKIGTGVDVTAYSYAVKNFDASITWLTMSSVLGTESRTYTAADIDYKIDSSNRVIQIVATGAANAQSGYVEVEYY